MRPRTTPRVLLSELRRAKRNLLPALRDRDAASTRSAGLDSLDSVVGISGVLPHSDSPTAQQREGQPDRSLGRSRSAQGLDLEFAGLKSVAMSTWTACLGGRGLERGRRLYLVTVFFRSGDMDTVQSGQPRQFAVCDRLL
jgi:hypothetical protein